MVSYNAVYAVEVDLKDVLILVVVEDGLVPKLWVADVDSSLS